MEAWTAKEIREYTSMTQAEFSEYTGIPKRTIEEWETGKRTPPEYVLKLLQRAIIEDANSGRLTRGWNGNAWEPIRRGEYT